MNGSIGVDKSHSKERGGTGLGLSIVKHGAILHGAKVNVESNVGKGTRMEILFTREERECNMESKKEIDAEI